MGASQGIRVSTPSFSRSDDGRILLEAEIDGLGGRRATIQFRITGAGAGIGPRDVSSNCLAVGLLIPAMERGQDLHLEGAASPRLIHSLNHNVVPLLLGTMPSLHRVRVSAAKSSGMAAGSEGRGAATGLSAGVDSLTTVADYTGR